MFPSSSSNYNMFTVQQQGTNSSTNLDQFQSTVCPTSLTLSIPRLSNTSNSTSTAASNNVEWSSSLFVEIPQPQPQQQLLIDTNSLSNTNSSLGNFGMFKDLSEIALEQALNALMFTNRNRSSSVGANTNTLGFSPTVSNNNSSNNFTPLSLSNTNTNNSQFSTSLPNNANYMTTKSILSYDNQQFNPPYMVKSDYKVSTTNNQENTNHNDIGEMISTFFLESQPQASNTSIFGNYNPHANVQAQNYSQSNQQNGFVIHSQVPVVNQQPTVHSFASPAVMNNLLTTPPTISQPTSPDQQFSQLNIQTANFSPNCISPPTISQAISQPISIPNMVNSMSTTPPTTNGKLRKQRSSSNVSSSSSSSNPYVLPNQQQFTFESSNQLGSSSSDTSPRKGRKSIKFQIQWTDNAQKFEAKHTSFTPSSMRQHIAARDERERNGSKKRGRPKGSGIKQQVKRGDLVFYKNCYHSVGDLYKGGVGCDENIPNIPPEEEEEEE